MASSPKPTWPVKFYLVALVIPISFSLGSIHLSPYRAFLLLAMIPALVKFLMDREIKVILPDVAAFLYAAWGIVTIYTGTGPLGGPEAAGSMFIETFGAYLLARVYVRDADSFRAFAKWLLFLVLLLLPFAMYEAVMRRPIILETVGKFFRTHTIAYVEERLNMRRAQGPLEHPILFGVFCSTAFGLTLYTIRPRISRFGRAIRAGLVALATFFSLSAGAYLAVVGQLFFAAWDRFVTFTPHRWRILMGLCVLAYVTVDLISNRTPFHVFITYLSFNTGSAYNRILIWDFGLAEVWRHPILGMGLFNDWERPWWMKGSIDNFWLLRTMRHGIPGFIFLATVVLSISIRLSKFKTQDPVVDSCRRAILSTLGGLWIAMITVDLWSGTYTYFWFLIGTAVWLIDPKRPRDDEAVAAGGDVEQPEIRQPHGHRPARPAGGPPPHSPPPARRPPIAGYGD